MHAVLGPASLRPWAHTARWSLARCRLRSRGRFDSDCARTTTRGRRGSRASPRAATTGRSRATAPRPAGRRARSHACRRSPSGVPGDPQRRHIRQAAHRGSGLKGRAAELGVAVGVDEQALARGADRPAGRIAGTAVLGGADAPCPSPARRSGVAAGPAPAGACAAPSEHQERHAERHGEPRADRPGGQQRERDGVAGSPVSHRRRSLGQRPRRVGESSTDLFTGSGPA